MQGGPGLVTKEDLRELKSDLRREIILWVGVMATVANLVSAIVGWAKYEVTPIEALAKILFFI